MHATILQAGPLAYLVSVILFTTVMTFNGVNVIYAVAVVNVISIARLEAQVKLIQGFMCSGRGGHPGISLPPPPPPPL